MNDKDDANTTLEGLEDLSLEQKINLVIQLQKRHVRIISKKIKYLRADITVNRNSQLNTDKEVSALKSRLETREKQISSMVKRLDGREDTSENREVQLWKFVGNSETLFQGLKESLIKANESLDDLRDRVVTKETCEKSRNICAESRKAKKFWYDYIPIIVSAVTLIVLVFGGFTWFIRGPAAIDPAMASELRQLINHSKLKINFSRVDIVDSKKKDASVTGVGSRW
jgi:hypothetical protein